MILIDTSIWIDHLGSHDPRVQSLLDSKEVLGHPHVVGELALGNLPNRQIVVNALRDLPQATSATEDEVLRFVQSNALFGKGIGWVDAHLLAAARLSGADLWTRDKRTLQAAKLVGVASGFA